MHMNLDNEMQKFICKEIGGKYECNLKQCGVNLRYERNKRGELKPYELQQNDDKDVGILSQKCDFIHCYFLHSCMRFGIVDDQDMIENDEKDDEQIEEEEEDDEEKWMHKIQNIDIIKNEQAVYEKLIEDMGAFKWQTAHGFRNGQYNGLSHIQPKFQKQVNILRNNIKK